MSPRYIEWTGLKHSELMGLSRGHGDAYDALDSAAVDLANVHHDASPSHAAAALTSAPPVAAVVLLQQQWFCYSCCAKLLQTSRAEACLQLKGDIEDMRAIAVATGLIPPSRLPSSCRGLKQLQEIPIGVDHWSLSWTDMPLRHPGTGLIRHTITCMSNQTSQAMGSLMTLGTPGYRCVRRVLLFPIQHCQPMLYGRARPAKA
eukprot:GHUV01026392.1.p2 GENE.GHUV01026392.1~~GHUV01026392.1.p2  ORF type:complete len:203 (+),score=37.86 GHUV01026392.1:1679-2287(+)